MRKGSKRLLRAGILAGIAYAGWRAWQARVPRRSTDDLVGGRRRSRSRRSPGPGSEAPVAEAPNGRAERPSRPSSPAPTASCPVTHPVKAKLASGIYHVPGGGNYERTKPDRCYVDADAAEADGLRAAKR